MFLGLVPTNALILTALDNFRLRFGALGSDEFYLFALPISWAPGFHEREKGCE